MVARKALPTTIATPVPAAPRKVPTVALDRGAAAALRRLRLLEETKASIVEKIKAEEVRIKQFMGDAEEATVKGVRVATWKTALRTSLSQTLIKKEYPEVAAACMVETEVRTFKIVAP